MKSSLLNKHLERSHAELTDKDPSYFQQKKPQTFGEHLVLPCIKEAVRLMLGEDDVKKLAPLSISNNIAHSRIVDMSEIVSEMKQHHWVYSVSS
ncbi:SCAN domain-containing protein 3 [Oopsacas minuta]|uniref:SCAN domain-containing protein 3 n=1 Tax=Oopsacas minuta TaxID=111878 RepID=A0AAV7K5K5_9METZ|nr:SCAN domain-containing protein 3 [Oopsacas minuta]